MEETFSLLIRHLEEMRLFGRMIGEMARAGDVICLEGDLGAGKTTLTQAIAQGLEVPADQYVTSPSFAIFHEYPGRIPLYHMDFYRLHGPDEIEELGLDEYFYLDGLTVIEWPARATGLLPVDCLVLELANPGDDSRMVHCVCRGSWPERIATLLERYQLLLPGGGRA
jgi:tRNA threonylcarbamoyladenosine biosynthesis protein TsaE